MCVCRCVCVCVLGVRGDSCLYAYWLVIRQGPVVCCLFLAIKGNLLSDGGRTPPCVTGQVKMAVCVCVCECVSVRYN